MRDWQREIDNFLRHLRRNGSVRQYSAGYDLHADHFRIRLQLSNREELDYALTEHEMRMDDRALDHWIATVDRDVWERTGRYDPAREQAYDDVSGRSLMEGLDPTSIRQAALLAQMMRARRPRDPQADKKAEALFRQTAGAEAFEMLNAGQPLPMTGSKGTAYTLHKRSTYCVEDTAGNKYCAVVPGVPLWDHLLGIKLMVEQDEDKFLRTANKAANRPMSWDDAQRYELSASGLLTTAFNAE